MSISWPRSDARGRVLFDQDGQLADQLVGLNHREPLFVEAGGLRREDAAVHTAERRPAPQRIRGPEGVGGLLSAW